MLFVVGQRYSNKFGVSTECDREAPYVEAMAMNQAEAPERVRVECRG